jgi:hypothetical protein
MVTMPYIPRDPGLQIESQRQDQEHAGQSPIWNKLLKLQHRSEQTTLDARVRCGCPPPPQSTHRWSSRVDRVASMEFVTFFDL